MRKIALVVIGGVEVVALGYGVLVTYILTAWFLDEADAAHMSPADWYRIAITRFAVSIVAALVAATTVYGMNTFAARVIFRTRSRLPLVSAVAFGGMMLAAAAIAAVLFAIDKPFM